jgi:hypothetical protein
MSFQGSVNSALKSVAITNASLEAKKKAEERAQNTDATSKARLEVQKQRLELNKSVEARRNASVEIKKQEADNETLKQQNKAEDLKIKKKLANKSAKLMDKQAELTGQKTLTEKKKGYLIGAKVQKQRLQNKKAKERLEAEEYQRQSVKANAIEKGVDL